MTSRIWLTCVALLAMLLFAAPASASLVFTLDQADPTKGCCAPFGTVQLDQLTSSEVKVTVKLVKPGAFVSTGGPHHAFGFNITLPGPPIVGAPAILISNLSTGFVVSTPLSGEETPFGIFDYLIDCPDCGPGASNAKPGPLVFDVSVATGALSIYDFVQNLVKGPGNTKVPGYFFAADIIAANGQTGNVAAKGGGVVVTNVPEPTTLLIFGAGLARAAAMRRRKQKAA